MSSAYSSRFLAALILASSIPAFVCLVNFEVLNNDYAPWVALFSFLSFLSGAHAWMNLAYYASRDWRAYFNKRPVVFYVIPALFFLSVLMLVAQPNSNLGKFVFYSVTFAGLWHHSKQNWGILAIIGKIRSKNVVALRKPIVYAWPFFLIPWALQVPEASERFGGELSSASLICVSLFILYFIVAAIRGKFFQNQDWVVTLAAIATCFYFVPMVLLYGKPYALLIWAAAHGLQYYLMVFASMSFRVRGNAEFTGAAIAFVMICALTIVSYVSTTVINGDIWPSLTNRIILGVSVGINVAHFWVDAFIWKFSDKAVREIHGDAFNFPAASEYAVR